MAEIEDHTLAWMRRLDTKFDAMKTEIAAEMRGLRDDQTVMIRLLQRREAELDVMRALDRR
jgi:hypothetical protein